MLKSMLHKAVSSFLACIVLLSTVSFTVEKHFCGEFLMDISFTGDADDCGMAMEKASKKSCCKDEVNTIKGKDNLQNQTVKDFNFSNQLFLTAFYFYHKELLESTTSDRHYFKGLSPPYILRDYQVLYQSFLIWFFK